MIYQASRLIFIRAETPLHAGVGRGEKAYVDLPIQRDEFNYPVLWSSSLKGAIKAVLPNDVRKLLGSDPEEPVMTPGKVSILDARLLLIPARTLSGVWTYVTTPHLYMMFKRYLELTGKLQQLEQASQRAASEQALIECLKQYKACTSIKNVIKNNRIVINEVELNTCSRLELINLMDWIPNELKNMIESKGLVFISDEDNLGLNIVNKSIIIQYRVRIKAESKTVESGPWSEEYVPIETVFVTALLCNSNEDCGRVAGELNNRKFIYLGGKETIGKGLIKLYIL